MVLAVLVAGLPGPRAAAVMPSDARPSDSDKGAAATAGTSAVADEPSGSLVLYWDETKERLTPTPILGARTVELSLADRKMLRRSDAGLKQMQTADQAGGTTVNIEGRFQSVYVSLLDSSGRLRVICLDGEPRADRVQAAKNGASHGH